MGNTFSCVRLILAGVCAAVLGGVLEPATSAADGDGSAPASPFQFTRREGFPEDGVALGQGWDAYLGKKTQAICVTGTTRSIAGNGSKLTLTRIDDKEQLFHALEISASAKYSGLSFSASVSTNFSKTTQIDNSSLNILSQVKVDRGGTFLGPLNEGESDDKSVVPGGTLHLTTAAAALLPKPPSKDYEKFRRLCGDGFVIAIRVGGELDAMFTLQQHTYDEKQKLTVTMNASGFGASASGSFSDEIKKLQDNKQLHMDFVQLGGNPVDLPTDAVTLTTKITGFASGNGDPAKFVDRPYELFVLDYRNLADFPQPDEDATQPEDMERWANMYWRIMNLHATYVDAIEHPDLYANVSLGAPYNSDAAVAALTDEDGWILDAARFINITLQECAVDRTCDMVKAIAKGIDRIVRRDTSGNARFKDILGFDASDIPAVMLNTFGQDGVDAFFKAQADINDSLGAQVASSVGKVFTDAVQKNIEAVKPMRALGNLPTQAQISALPKPQQALNPGGFQQNAVMQYYAWLADAPVRIVMKPGAAPPALVLDPDKSEFDLGKDSAEADEAKRVESTKKRYLDWIYKARFLPVAMAFCKEDPNNMMCLDPAALLDLAGTTAFNMSAEDIMKLNPPAPPAVPPKPQPRPTPLPREHGPCWPMHNFECI